MGGVPAVRSVWAILQWWGFNVTVIITNKWIFQKLHFTFPLTVSCIHFICSAMGAYIAIKLLRVKLIETIKSFTPATTVILQWLVWGKYFDWRVWASLIPIVGGIVLTSVTELSFNTYGFCAALVGCLATSTKTILAESLLHGYKFDSINTVYYMAPPATLLMSVLAILVEGHGVMNWFQTHESVLSSLIIILSSGVFAFFLNFSIFYVIHSTTAVTFNVAGNLKVYLLTQNLLQTSTQLC
ncbi:hypothetical protein J5N97_001903 [Dioscorea zingiberensis]|uniref:Sugar phosphate transporter domain-containing protein n=1 Tax=Dioscorea zingiberensis TaxID=325984 RepID=A0A9D5H1W2_9LILI|nr:hypothetical protein J5N97_001903 [Dioscorea zingiberensis]